VERDKPKRIGIGWTNFAAVAMETFWFAMVAILNPK
jgi:hypothetical protein